MHIESGGYQNNYLEYELIDASRLQTISPHDRQTPYTQETGVGVGTYVGSFVPERWTNIRSDGMRKSTGTHALTSRTQQQQLQQEAFYATVFSDSAHALEREQPSAVSDVCHVFLFLRWSSEARKHPSTAV